MNQRSLYFLLNFIFTLLLLSALSCSSSASQESQTGNTEDKTQIVHPYTPAQDLTEQDETAIYAAVLRQTITVPFEPFPIPTALETIYVVNKTYNNVGQTARDKGTRELSMAIMMNISNLLSDLPVKIIWIDSTEEVISGVRIRLRNLEVREDGSVKTVDEISTGGRSNGGRRYIVESVNGAWEVTDNTSGYITHWD